MSSNKKPRARGIFEQPVAKALDVTIVRTASSAKAPELASAVGHDDVHRNSVYYVRVERRLGAADQGQQAEERAALRKMRADIRGTGHSRSSACGRLRPW